MHEADEAIGHSVRFLDRIMILLAIMIAVPVISWTITAFVQNQPKVSIFLNLFTTNSINEPGHTTLVDSTKEQSAPRQAKSTELQGPGPIELAAPHAARMVGHPASATESVSEAQTADQSRAISDSATPMVAKEAEGLQPQLGANNSVAADGPPATPANELVHAPKAEADALAALAKLSEPIPLPRRRPQDAGTVRKANTAVSGMPMPRPRPLAAGSGAQQETTDEIGVHSEPSSSPSSDRENNNQ